MTSYVTPRYFPLITAPQLSAEYLTEGCYAGMFMRCNQLTESPMLNSRHLAPNCYDTMFYGCASLTKITCLAQEFSENSTTNWTNGVNRHGVFVKHVLNDNWEKESVNGIPLGWIVQNDYIPLTYKSLSITPEKYILPYDTTRVRVNYDLLTDGKSELIEDEYFTNVSIKGIDDSAPFSINNTGVPRLVSASYSSHELTATAEIKQEPDP